MLQREAGEYISILRLLRKRIYAYSPELQKESQKQSGKESGLARSVKCRDCKRKSLYISPRTFILIVVLSIFILLF